ncbi:UrcA family protein [Caulobacter sp. BE254]|uniref:UrcA family protein n=1 Tax=Caulobacter sp. BE254 TaxID=2817720 RepID=UPI002865A802|nr:UrcA family protein [Caulobacter sp. BE254]MDR7116441.1 UrcA family protein [Caulobacter sp. BE254]
MRKFMTSLAAVATVTLAAVPALGLLQAAHAAEPTVRIPFGDLDLADPAQAATFKTRVDTQGKALCRQVSGQNMRSNIREADCLAQVRQDVRRQLGAMHRADLRRSAALSSTQVASR